MPLEFRRLLLTETEFRALPPEAVRVDERRSRTLFFDGLFLTAAALQREQSYLLTRQADLARATGTGVVEGLRVGRAAGSGTRLVIEAGHGLTTQGEPVVLAGEMRVDLAELPLQRELAARLGQSTEPTPPLETRSGVFVLALRPLEFSSEPIAAYPTSLEASERRLEDSVINEAVLATLIPFAQAGGLADPGLRRARVAAAVFRGGEPLLPPACLPVAMLELAGNAIVWLDTHLVRREAAVAGSDVLGLGIAPEARRAAHLRHYEAMLDDVVHEREAAGRGLAFQAGEHFALLPAAGRLPAATLALVTDPVTGERVLTQSFFPPSVPVSLSPVPEDEVPALIEESLLLPPLDLEEQATVLENSPVTVFAPVTRSELAATLARLGRTERPLPPATRFGRLPVRPRDLLASLGRPAPLPPAEPPPADPSDAPWVELLAGRRFLWYARTVQIAARIDLLGEIRRARGEPVEPPPAPPSDPRPGPPSRPVLPDPLVDLDARESEVRVRLRDLGLEAALLDLRRRVPDRAVREHLHEALAEVQASGSTLLVQGAVRELAAVEELDAARLRSVQDRYGGELAAAIERIEPRLLDPAGSPRIVHRVNLVTAGPNPTAVVELLMAILGLPVQPARRIVERAPVVLPREFARSQDSGQAAARLRSVEAVAERMEEEVPPDPEAARDNERRRALLADSRSLPELGAIVVRGSQDLVEGTAERLGELLALPQTTAGEVRRLVLELHEGL